MPEPTHADVERLSVGDLTDLASEDFKDIPLGKRMACHAMGGRYVYASGLGWLEWDGRRWCVTPEERVVRFTAQWVENLITEMVRARVAGAWITKAVGYLDIRRASSLMSASKTSGRVLFHATDFDRDPYLLNVGNGVVDLRTGELRAHDPDLLITRLAPDDYEPGFRHTDWEMALNALDPDQAAYLQARVGQAAFGFPPPSDDLLVCQGSGENAKTTILGTLRAVFGDYGVLVSHRALMANPDAHPTELMDFRGARFAFMEETPEARRLDVVRLKSTIGTETIKARRMRQDPIEFATTHSLFISSNYAPVVAETDHGTWRRLLLLVFEYTYKKRPEEITKPTDRLGDPTIKARLRTPNSPGRRAALSWLVEGAVAFCAAGEVMPPPPKSVLTSTHEWRLNSDLILRYVTERLVPDKDCGIVATDLHDDFNWWLLTRGHPGWSFETIATRFGTHEMVTSASVEKKRTRSPKISTPPRGETPTMVLTATGQHVVWLGIRFATDADRARRWWSGETEPDTSLGVVS